MDPTLHDLVRGPGDRTILNDGERDWSRSDFAAAVGRASGALRARGVLPGDMVVVETVPGVQTPIALLGARAAGAVACPVAAADLSAALAAIDPRVVVTERAVDGRATVTTSALLAQDHSLEIVDGEGVAWGIRTSGSTGKAKTVLLSEDTVAAITESSRTLLGYSGDDRVHSPLPFHHILGLSQLWVTLRAGALLVIPRAALSPAELVAWARDATIFPAIPLYMRWLSKSATRPAFRTVTLGGQPTLPADRRQFAEAFPRTAFFNVYGLTEAFRALWLHPDEFVSEVEATGRPFPGMTATLAEDGELWLEGAHVATSYHRDPDGTAARFPRPRTVRTGDLFRRSGDLFTYVGRADAMFKSRGEKVIPELVERALEAHPGVARCLVTATSLDGRELQPIARIVATGAPPTADELRRFLGDLVPAAMIPIRFDVVETLPMTPSGKLLRGQS